MGAIIHQKGGEGNSYAYGWRRAVSARANAISGK
jgi:hypothetical protein